MGELRALLIAAVVAAIITYVYFQYTRPAFGRRGATALAVLVFVLLIVLLGEQFCSRMI